MIRSPEACRQQQASPTVLYADTQVRELLYKAETACHCGDLPLEVSLHENEDGHPGTKNESERHVDRCVSDMALHPKQRVIEWWPEGPITAVTSSCKLRLARA